MLASIIIPVGDQYNTPESRGKLFRGILDSVRTLPGVESAGAVDALPFSGENGGATIANDSGGGEQIAESDRVSAEYLQTMGVRLLQGRWFHDGEVEDPALVNDVVASRLWPGQSALGKRICINCDPEKPKQWKPVIGVVSSVHHAALDEPGGAEVYLSEGALEAAAFLVAGLIGRGTI